MPRTVLKGTRFIPLRPALPRPFVPCNPSILRTPDGYLVNCRGVHITRPPSRRRGVDGEVRIRSRNVLMRFSPDLTLLAEHPVVIDAPPLRETSIRGLEDCRLFEVDGTLFVLCATADRHPSGHIHLSLCQLELDGRVSVHRPLVGPFDDRPQKNWLPFVDARGTLRAIYGYAPFTVLGVDVESGRYHLAAAVTHSRRARTWRGSAGPVAIPDSGRLLMLVHDVVIRDGANRRQERIYRHRFLECDGSFALTRVTGPFVFTHEGIEFACGMALAHRAGSLIIGLGIEDSSAYLCEVDFEQVEWMLRPPKIRK